MAVVDLDELVRVQAVPKSTAKCHDCEWKLTSHSHHVLVAVQGPDRLHQRAQLHALHKPGHRVTVTVVTETAYALP
jgi:hypothetical protein